MPSPARLVCIPSADTAFAAEAQRIATRIPGELSRADALTWYVRALRRAYPTTVVREQEELARFPGEVAVWYVTRRGHPFRIDTSLWVPLEPADAYLIYVERMPEWQTSVELQPPRRTADLIGTEYDATYDFLGRRYAGVFRVLMADPGRSVSLEAEGSGITVWYVTSFSAENGGTRVSIRGGYDLPNTRLARISDRLGTQRAITRDIERANETFRDMCAAVAQAR